MRRPRGPVPLSRVFARYLAFQVPGLVVAGAALGAAVHWWDLPPALAVLGVALWLLKDLALFPFVRSAYEPGDAGADVLVGERGTAEEAIDPRGYVRVGPELWRAELAPGAAPVPRGAAVRVLRVRSLTLLVEAAED